MVKLLEIGDVISLESGHKVYYKSKDKPYTTDVRISDQTYPELIGDYVVVNTEFSGGGYGHGMNDYYPNGHRVFCKKLNNQQWDANEIEVNFYQTGSFTAMIQDILPVRKMSMSFS
ncbi:hypothetical protein [Paenibacillus silvae]|uniref:Uncharacterized protein n=1 Tax=Paenibacillus silvae TaxID=1325358 RepID=A0A2W6NNC3_9BACL|nr:hypothetical protein [Paenibacillus silvae]PZT57359.1 hypothetical protein DN757_01505 [Paenibacillus silvae]